VEKARPTLTTNNVVEVKGKEKEEVTNNLRTDEPTY